MIGTVRVDRPWAGCYLAGGPAATRTGPGRLSVRTRWMVTAVGLLAAAAEPAVAEEPAAAEQVAATCIEQEVVRERTPGQPAIEGRQRICFTERVVRNEVRYGDQRTVSILDLANQRIALMPGPEPQVIELALSDYRRLVALRLSASGLNDPRAEPRLQPTGEVRQIGRWTCRQWMFEQDGPVPVRSELWLATEAELDFAAWLRLMQNLGLTAALGRLGDFVEQLEGLPIEMQTTMEVSDQKLVSTTRVRSIESGPMDAALFRVPADYERVEPGPMPALRAADTE